MATAQLEREQRVVVPASWQSYESLLAARGENQAPRYAYYDGRLEILSPLLPEHEMSSEHIKLLISIVAEEAQIDIGPLGTTTLKRDDIRAGIEPDASFYIENEGRMRGKSRLDLPADPPPDLAVEVDITNPSLDKMSIYAAFGVPEVWRYDGRQLEIHILEGGAYRESLESRALRGVTSEDVTRFLKRRRSMGSVAWTAEVRVWAGGFGKCEPRS